MRMALQKRANVPVGYGHCESKFGRMEVRWRLVVQRKLVPAHQHISDVNE